MKGVSADDKSGGFFTGGGGQEGSIKKSVSKNDIRRFSFVFEFYLFRFFGAQLVLVLS